MAVALHVELVSPIGVLVEGVFDAVSVPTSQGEISILPHHIPLISTVGLGELKLRKGKELSSFVVSGGVLCVHEGSRVTVLADIAERAEEISEAAVTDAMRRARELRARVVVDDQAFAAATASLERELARYRVVRKLRHQRPHGPARGSRPAA